MTTVPYHLQHNERDYALQYGHPNEEDAIADEIDGTRRQLCSPSNWTTAITASTRHQPPRRFDSGR